MQENKGVSLILITAFISGVSIFINAFGVQGINPFIFTGLKNLIVGVLLFGLLLGLNEWRVLKKISRRDLGNLIIIGLVGGSIPFLLFFKGLQMSNASAGSFIHKTMFVFATFLAFYFLKERINKGLLVGALLLLVGNGLLLKIGWGGTTKGYLLILLATIFWALENVISKHLLLRLSARIVAFGRMFFGSLFILVFLIMVGEFNQIGNLDREELAWIVVTSIFLFIYVITWYTGLKYSRVSVATSILLIGSPITTSLNWLFLGKNIDLTQAIGMLLVALGVVLAVGLGPLIQAIKGISVFLPKIIKGKAHGY